MSRSWEAVFTQIFPRAIDVHADRMTKLLQKLRSKLESREHLQSSPAALQSMLDLIEEYSKHLQTTTLRKGTITETQRSASRQVTSSIRSKMASVYSDCMRK